MTIPYRVHDSDISATTLLSIMLVNGGTMVDQIIHVLLSHVKEEKVIVDQMLPLLGKGLVYRH